jgi:hypothetical protein
LSLSQAASIASKDRITGEELIGMNVEGSFHDLNGSNRSRYSDGLRAGLSGFDSQHGKISLFTIASTPALGPTEPHIQWVPGVKRSGSEADHSPSTDEVKNGGAMPPLSHVSSWRSA